MTDQTKSPAEAAAEEIFMPYARFFVQGGSLKRAAIEKFAAIIARHCAEQTRANSYDNNKVQRVIAENFRMRKQLDHKGGVLEALVEAAENMLWYSRNAARFPDSTDYQKWQQAIDNAKEQHS